MHNINELRLKKRKLINTNFQITQVEAFKKILSEITNNHKKIKVLEIGCSYGFWLDLLRLNYDFDLYGIDIYNSIAPSLREKIKFIIGNGTKLPFRKNSFDIVYHIDVIEHIENDYEFILENYRILKKGGFCILGTPNRNRLSAVLKMILLQPNKYPLKIKDEIFGYVTHIREYTLQEIKSLVLKTEFKIIKTLPVYLGLPKGILDKISIKYPKVFFKNFAQFLFLVMQK